MNKFFKDTMQGLVEALEIEKSSVNSRKGRNIKASPSETVRDDAVCMSCSKQKNRCNTV